MPDKACLTMQNNPKWWTKTKAIAWTAADVRSHKKSIKLQVEAIAYYMLKKKVQHHPKYKFYSLKMLY